MGEGTFPKVDGDVLFASETNTVMGLLGQIIQVDISRTNAVNKAYLQGQGWAICDGTTPASQGISDATITTTPDLRSKFLRHSADETTGGTGGSSDNIHMWVNKTGSEGSGKSSISGFNGSTVQQRSFNSSGTEVNVAIGQGSNATYINGAYYTDKQDNRPPYYDICFFIKVK